MAEAVRRFLAVKAGLKTPVRAEAHEVEKACGFKPGERSLKSQHTFAYIQEGPFRAGVAEGKAHRPANEIALFRSELRPSGAHYNPLERIALQGRAAQGGHVYP